MDVFNPVVDKDLLSNENDVPFTQSLFIEHAYDTSKAVYSWGNKDKKYKGKVYPSLKCIYIEMEDLTEYQFATTHLISWKHWKKFEGNAILKKHIDEWREELELKMRSQAIRSIIEQSTAESGGYQAARYLADKGWDKRGAGRPSKEEKEKMQAMDEKLSERYSSDITRMNDFRKK